MWRGDASQPPSQGASQHPSQLASQDASPVVRGSGKKKEEKDLDVQRELFQRFWRIYPRNSEGEKAAFRVWLNISPAEAFAAEIAAAAQRFAASPSVQTNLARGEVQYIKLAKNWLADEGWMDAPAASPSVKVSGCHHRHTPPCVDDAACTERYLSEFRDSGVNSEPVVEGRS
jgi:hypothetical protein